jgi:RNA binding exosome subunit
LARNPITYIDIRYFAHATEDLNKVAEAMQHILPSDHLDEITFKRHNLRGHYGNLIALFETRIRNKKIINSLVENLSTRLNQAAKQTLLNEVDRHVEKGSLYIRLDKQAALQGDLNLCTADPIRVRLRFKKSDPQNIRRICQELNLLTPA